MGISDLLSQYATYISTAGVIAIVIDRWVHRQETNTERIGVRIDAMLVQLKAYCDRIDDVERELEKIENGIENHRREASGRASEQQVRVGEFGMRLVALEEDKKQRDRDYRPRPPR